MDLEDNNSLTETMQRLDHDRTNIETWRSTIERCKNTLERRDLRDALLIKSAERLRKYIDDTQYGNKSTEIEVLTLLVPTLDHYEQFANSFVHLMHNEIDVSMMWGLLYLVLKLGLDLAETLDPINRIIKSIGTKVERMNETMDNIENKEQMKNSYMDISTELVNLWLSIISAYRGSNVEWDEIMSRSNRVTGHLEEVIDRISTSKFNVSTSHRDGSDRQQALVRSETTTLSHTEASFPCYMLPSPRNPRFFGRGIELDEIHKYLQPEISNKRLNSIAIHGLGGVGKSQIALMYAHQHLQDYDAIFWFRAQTLASLEQSVNEAVRLLRIDGPSADAKNLVVFHNWLQTTDRPWLLIFDNAENAKWVNTYWPHTVSDRGSSLITSRSPLFSMHLATMSLPVGPFNDHDGAVFIFHLLHSDTLSMGDQEAARSLSTLVGGHILALTQATSLLYKKNWSITKYLEMHARYPHQIRDCHSMEWMHAGYTESTKTVFLISFQSLSESALTMLSILALIAPDAIPESLFVKVSARLSPRLQFCEDEFRVSEVVEELTSMALVNRNSETDRLSVHRLVQSEMRYYIREDIQKAFNDASLLLFHAFPQQIHGRTFEPQFPQCEMFIQHVYSLRDHLSLSAASNSSLQPSTLFCRLICNAAYYLVEKGATKELGKTISVAMDAFRSSNLIVKDSLAYAHLCNSAALEREMSGDFASSKTFLETSRDIRCKELPPGHEDIWVVMNNLGNLALSMGRPDEALRYHLTCKDTVNMAVAKNVAINANNIARAYTALGRFSDAMDHLDKSKALFASSELGFRNYYYWAGNLFLAQGNLEEATAMYKSGQEVLAACGEALSPDMATCCYKLGIIHLRQYYTHKDQKHLSSCIETFREAITMMELGKVADCEVARVSYMLSISLSIRGDDQEARKWREKAEATRKKLQGESYYADAHGEWTYDMLVESWVR